MRRAWAAPVAGAVLGVLVGAAVVHAQTPADSGSSPGVLTLHAALAYAHARSPHLAAARQGVRTESANIAAARARRWPALDLRAAYREAGTPTRTAVTFPPLSGLSDIPGTQPLGREHLNAAAYITAPIYQGGQISAAIRLAQAQRTLAVTQEADVARKLDFEVIRTYARVSELVQDARAANRSRQALEESRRVIAQMVQVGKAARVDLLKVDTRLADVRARLISYQNAERVAAGQLNALLGRSVDLPLVPEDTLPHPLIQLSMRQAEEAALRNNSAYQLAAARVRVSAGNVALARTQLHPSVSLGLGYESQSVDPLSRHYAALPVAGVVVSVPVYSRALNQEISVTESREQERRLDLEQLRLDIAQQTRTAYVQVQDAAERIQATEAAIASADEALRIEQQMERLGRGTIEHLLDAEAARFTAEADYVSARADYATAVAALARETGMPLIQPEQTR